MIRTTEDAQKYLDETHRHLDELTQLSIEAGMNTHASMWYAISAAFYESMEEVETLVDMMHMYACKKLSIPYPKNIQEKIGE